MDSLHKVAMQELTDRLNMQTLSNSSDRTQWGIEMREAEEIIQEVVDFLEERKFQWSEKWTAWYKRAKEFLGEEIKEPNV